MSHQILPMVERFLRESDIPPSVFGREAVRDPRLVSDLRAGREVGSKIRQRVADYITEWRAQKSAGTVCVIGDRRTHQGRNKAEAALLTGIAPLMTCRQSGPSAAPSAQTQSGAPQAGARA
jgi:hypothetical protein